MSDRNGFGSMGDLDLEGGGYAPVAVPRGAPGKVPVTARLGSVLILRKDDGTSARLRPEQAMEHIASSSGAPLPGAVQERFEASLGADLSAVRVHTGAASHAATAAVGARAFAVGNDVHFAAGQYQPDDPFGLHLLAHEVAHTQQQAGGAAVPQHKLAVSQAGDAAEREADHAADAMVAGASFRVSAAPASIARRGTEAVGGTTEDAMWVVDERVANDGNSDNVVQPGQRGFSEVLVTQSMPAQEGDIAETAGEGDKFLEGVAMESGSLDAQIQKQAWLVGIYEQQGKENHLLANTDRNIESKKQLELLYAQREEITSKIAAFNNWKVLPNSAIMAVARLDRMAMSFGANDEGSLLSAIKKGVGDAKRLMGEAQKDKHDGGDGKALEQVEDAIPKEDIKGAMGDVDTALGELGVAQGMLRAQMLGKESAKEDESGEEARQRKAKIAQYKADLQAACAALDSSVAKVNAAPGKLHQMATAVNEASDNASAKKDLVKNIARAQTGHTDKMDVAYDFEKNWASLTAGHGKLSTDTAAGYAPVKSPLVDPSTDGTIPSLPTDVGSLISTGAGVIMDFAFAGELRAIDQKLEEVAAKVNALNGLGQKIDADAIIANFRVKLMAFSRAMDQAQSRLKKSHTDYVRFGERLDALARDLSARKRKTKGPAAPSADDEHFAMIFAVAGALKEVAAFGDQAGTSSGQTGNAGAAAGAGAGLGDFSSASIIAWRAKLKQARKKIKQKLPDALDQPMGDEAATIEEMLTFVRRWEDVKPRIGRCGEVSGQVDTLLAELRPG